ncbi:MAG TPA: helix-turn-helix domain-containing protein [Bacillota bacterium]
MSLPTFGYPCQECGQGIVEPKVRPKYETKIHGHPFVVENAVIGVCNKCDAEHFSSAERERWEQLFEESHRHLYLSPGQIRELRQSLGLTTEQFAQLIGSTRQSIYNWELPNRKSNQSRTADLLFRLVSESWQTGKVEVIAFLTQRAKEWGHELHLQGGNEGDTTFWLKVQCSPLKEETPAYAKLAADSGGDRMIRVLRDASGRACGEISYDFAEGALAVELYDGHGDRPVDMEVVYTDGARNTVPGLDLSTGRSTFLKGVSPKTLDHIAKIGLHRRLRSR